jgi:hypothetical protein
MLDDACTSSGYSNLTRAAVKQIDLSAQAYHHVRKPTRTFAKHPHRHGPRSEHQLQHLAVAPQHHPRSIAEFCNQLEAMRSIVAMV